MSSREQANVGYAGKRLSGPRLQMIGRQMVSS